MVLRPRGRGRVGRRRHIYQKASARFRAEAFAHLVISRVRHTEMRPSTAVPLPGSFHEMPRAGIVSVVGRPNAGKSTLLNRIVGQKLSITSPKPQSTRDQIIGIQTTDDAQIVMVDTPGLLDPRYALQRAMRATALRALGDADVIVYVTDAEERAPPPLAEAAKLDAPPIAPVITAANKIDALTVA